MLVFYNICYLVPRNEAWRVAIVVLHVLGLMRGFVVVWERAMCADACLCVVDY
jgi:hypothetical protein